jgi:hypothetical protein
VGGGVAYPQAIAGPRSDRQAIQELLDRRADALVARDKDAFMGTIAQSSPQFVKRQSHLFDWMANVPLESYRLIADWAKFGDLVRDMDKARYPEAQAVAIPVTEERYRLKGLDSRPAAEDIFYTYVNVNGTWLVAEDRDLEDMGLDSARHLWDFGPIQVQRAGRFAVMTHPCRQQPTCARLPAGMGTLLTAAAARVRRYWQGPMPRAVAVLVPDTARELRRMLQATFDLTNFVAFAYTTVDDPDRGFGFSGPRIVLNWRSLESRSDVSTESVLAHELLHVVTRSTSGPLVPVFVEEGFADFVGNDASPASLAFFDAQVAAGAVAGVLPEDFQFTTGGGTEIFLSYQESQSAVGFFVRTWGLPAFERFYRMLGRVRVMAGTSEYHIDRALRRTIGIGFERFQQAWAGSLGR